MLSKEDISHTNDSTKFGIWVLILGIIFAGANLRAPITSVGPIIETIRQDTGISNTSAGLLTTLPLLAFAFFSILAPKIARRFGIEYTLFGALLLLATGILLRSVPFINTLFIGTALLGIAIAVCNVLLPGLIKREFPNKVGLMTGTYSVSLNLWAAIASGISITLTQGFGYGWRNALVFWVFLSILSILFWIPQLRVHHRPSNSPKQENTLWHSGLAWKVAFFMGLQSSITYSIFAWFPTILHQQGMSQTAAGWLLSLAQFASLPATFIVPILAGRSSNQRSLVGFVVICLLLGCFGLLSGITLLAPLYAILLGFAIGAAFGLATMFFTLRTYNANQAAELSGMAQSVGYIIAAIFPTLFGFIHDITHSWTIPLLILIAVTILLFIVGMDAGKNQYVISQESINKSSSLKQKAK
ncbi:MFS transporter [Bacillus sp. M6-12]|uniref:CynX/NimT family MFS transporter n=1 Tax=Bacillus sp. M6-12 TaxID=2054166 RepID=UPI000C780FBC|nr:MFS transporter [Bacillus sp. M6-12]PLS15261.1 MFS transporter [Bacillus sp. M6-12]